MNFIGIDIGTSFIKGGVLDLDGMTIHSIQRQAFPEPIAGLPALHFEVDPHAVVHAVRTLVESLLDSIPDCAGIVMCSQMHGLVLMDAAGTPVSNVITWRDQRALASHPAGGTYFDRMMAQIDERERQELGNGLRAGLPICALYWLAEERKLPPNAIPATLPDFVIAQLCPGAANPGVEPTNAAAHGAFNVSTRNWHHQVIQRLGLGELNWPEVRAVNDVAGVLTIRGKEIPCYAPVGDHQCALAGTFLESGELSLNVSTGSQVSLVTETLTFGDYEIRPYFDDRYLNTLVQIPAGRALDALVALLTELARRSGVELDDPWAHITAAVEETPQSDLEINLAFFASALGDRGQIANISEENLSVGHLFRAAYQEMANNYLHCALRLSPERTWSRLVFSGGLVQKQDALRTLIQTRFGDAYRLCASTEDALLGLLSLALFASGQTGSVEESAARLRKHTDAA